MLLLNFLRKKLSTKTKRKIRRLISNIRTLGYGNNLNKLALIYGSDKWGSHFYTQHYSTHFRPFKTKKINLLEIGVGGYSSKSKGGESLYMWKRYFSKAKIFSVDIFDKSFLQEKRIRIFKGSQVDKDFIENVVFKEMLEVDLIIDDGSHINEHVIETFKILFPKLKSGGIYVIEDTQTSYWPRFGGDSIDLNNPNTIINYFKTLVDCINWVDIIRDDYHPTYLEKHITSIHFYHNIIFIYKGDNNEHATITSDRVRIGSIMEAIKQ
ncbi:MAG: CmcI family methyltransferase [Ilyomonas sp.]